MKNQSSPVRPVGPVLAAVLLFILSPIFAPVTPAQQVAQVEMGLIHDLQGNGQDNALKGQLAVELGFIRRTCHPTPEQKEQILAVAKECLDVLAEANKRAQPRRGGGRFIVRNGRIQEREGPSSLREELRKELRGILENDQWERYQEECEQREAFRKGVFLDQVMACYKRRLLLTPAQQKEIRASLESKWEPGPQASLRLLINNPQYLPQIPEEMVLPCLDADQKKVFEAASKLNLQQRTGGDQAVWFQEEFWEVPE